MKMKLLGWIASILVLAAVIAGFVTVGSPAKQRNMKFDQQRISDLSTIQYQIRNYWSLNGKLPASLAAISSDVSGYVPKDPESKKDYDYMVTGDLTFRLCADFNLPSGEDRQPQMSQIYELGVSENWTHGAGLVCFDRKINPEVDKLQPPIK